MAEPLNPLGAGAFTGPGSPTWLKNAIREMTEEFNVPDTWSARIKAALVDIGAAEAQRVADEKVAVDWAIGKVMENPLDIRRKIAELMVWEFKIFTGITLPVDVVYRIAGGDPTPADAALLGEPLFKYLTDQILKGDIATSTLARDSGAPEMVTIGALMGASLRLQLGAQYVRHLAAALPSQFKRGVEFVADLVDKSVNLDDAIEDLLQAPLQAWIDKGILAQVNRATKPADLSDNEARQALIAEKIDAETYGKILDNHGVRDDIRATLLDFAAGNLTESDLDQLYQHNLLSREEVKEQYKQKFFQEPERELKTKLVEGTRRWKLEEKIFELYGNLYRDGVATRAEVTPFLQHFGYDADEIDMWFQVQELERRQRRWLSTANVVDLVDDGMMQADFAIDYLVMQGMTGEDATILMLNALLKKHQKDLPEDCQKVLTEAFTLSKVLAAALSKIPSFGLDSIFGKSDLQKIIECLIKASQAPTP